MVVFVVRRGLNPHLDSIFGNGEVILSDQAPQKATVNSDKM